MKDSIFTGKNIALTAIFAAFAYGLSFLGFSFLPPLTFLKLDFSFAVMLLFAYMRGPLLGEIVVLIATILKLPLSDTACIGEFANFVMAQIFVVLPSVAYKYKRSFKTVWISLTLATFALAALGLFFNRFLLFPFYMEDGAAETFASFWYLIAIFNVIKGASNALVTVLLYKRLKRALERFF